MIEGAGSPVLNVLEKAQTAAGGVAFLSSGNEKSNTSARVTELADLVELSDQAKEQLSNYQETIDTLQEGRGKLAAQEIDFIKEQLVQIEEQLSFINKLLQSSSSDAVDIGLKGLEQAFIPLENIANRLGLISPGNTVQSRETTLEIQSLQLSASFNSVAAVQDKNGNVSVVAESHQLDITITQATLTYTEQAYNSQSLVTGGFSDNPFDQLTSNFTKVLRGFRAALKEVEELLANENRFPPGFLSIVRELTRFPRTDEGSGFNRSA